MNINTLREESLEAEGRRIFREFARRGQAESGNVKTSAEDLAAMLRRLSDAPNRETEKLINHLQNLRTQLQNAGNRIQRDIAE